MAEKVVIIGSGPAGWTAAIYAARANLDPLLYEGEPKHGDIPGGQLMFTTEVENYPGFPEGIEGPEMMERFREQAERFEVRVETADITSIDFSRRPFILNDSEEETVEAHAVIIATGAKANWLGLENEQRLAQSGGGVSACAVCDGALPIFRNKVLAVVGGGDAAVEEAVYLTKYASRVHVIHRRGELRASKSMQDRALQNPKIQFHWHKTVVDVLGRKRITGLELRDTVHHTKSTMRAEGLFLAIGHTPNTAFLDGQIELDQKGYIVPQKAFRTDTNIEGVFAVGDVMDSHYRQAITAAGLGCMGALDAERWLTSKGLA
jgi:thioredoxin reductase (NADPH)